MAEAQPQGTGRTGEGRTGPQGTGKAAGGRSAQLAHTGLRHGWTTGACATAASTAAYTALLSGEFPDPVTITLPKGQTPSFALAVEKLTVEELTVEELTGEGPAPGRTAAMAGVVKDAGDDPDVTHGALVRATVRALPPGSGVVFKAGPGVGTVTRPGLPLDVGEPAVNPVPRQMMREHLAEVAAQYGGPGAAADVEVEISVDHGEEIARSTWNPRLGILGGLSILGPPGSWCLTPARPGSTPSGAVWTWRGRRGGGMWPGVRDRRRRRPPSPCTTCPRTRCWTWGTSRGRC